MGNETEAMKVEAASPNTNIVVTPSPDQKKDGTPISGAGALPGAVRTSTPPSTDSKKDNQQLGSILVSPVTGHNPPPSVSSQGQRTVLADDDAKYLKNYFKEIGYVKGATYVEVYRGLFAIQVANLNEEAFTGFRRSLGSVPWDGMKKAAENKVVEFWELCPKQTAQGENKTESVRATVTGCNNAYRKFCSDEKEIQKFNDKLEKIAAKYGSNKNSKIFEKFYLLSSPHKNIKRMKKIVKEYTPQGTEEPSSCCLGL